MVGGSGPLWANGVCPPLAVRLSGTESAGKWGRAGEWGGVHGW